jgi:hypothetical protein
MVPVEAIRLPRIKVPGLNEKSNKSIAAIRVIDKSAAPGFYA